uniref:Uncharacterized protein n=1 Tax=Leersia perrieri TaxID=77586 RepID=A0A0D9WNV9_9ORYZ
MPEAHYSSASTMVPVNCKLSMACTAPSIVLQGPDCLANSADQQQNAPSLINGTLERETQHPRPNQGVDSSSSITQAADILVALSAHGKKDRSSLLQLSLSNRKINLSRTGRIRFDSMPTPLKCKDQNGVERFVFHPCVITATQFSVPTWGVFLKRIASPDGTTLITVLQMRLSIHWRPQA